MPRRTGILFAGHPINFAHPLVHGLLAWWLVHPTLNGAGLRWVDMLMGYVGTPTAMASPSTATSGWGLSTTRRGGLGEMRFDGTNDKVEMGDILNFGDTSPLSLAVSVKLPSATPSTPTQILSKVDGSYVGYHLVIRGDIANDPMEFELRSATNQLSVRSNQVWVPEQWTRLAVTYTGSVSAVDILMYRDGRPAQMSVESNTLTGTIINTAPFRLGTLGATSSPFLGAMDDIRLWNYPLSPAMVALDYANSEAGYPGLFQRRQRHTAFANVAAASGGVISQSRIVGGVGIAQSAIGGGG